MVSTFSIFPFTGINLLHNLCFICKLVDVVKLAYSWPFLATYRYIFIAISKWFLEKGVRTTKRKLLEVTSSLIYFSCDLVLLQIRTNQSDCKIYHKEHRQQEVNIIKKDEGLSVCPETIVSVHSLIQERICVRPCATVLSLVNQN